MRLHHLLAALGLLFPLLAGAQASTPLDGFQATHILVSRAAPLDVPPVLSSGPALMAGLVGGVILQAIVLKGLPAQVDQRKTAKQRRHVADLVADPAIAEWTRTFQQSVGERLLRRYGAAGASLEHFDTLGPRQQREVDLDPATVLKAEIAVVLHPQRDCGSVGVVISHGEPYFKQALDIKRRPVQTYVPRTRAALALVSEWCLPGSRNTYRERKVGDQKIAVAADLLPILALRASEILDALTELPVGPMDPDAVGTIGPRDLPWVIARYGQKRTWITTIDHSVLRMVPNSDLQPYDCTNACGPLRRALAAETARREAWIRANGPMQED